MPNWCWTNITFYSKDKSVIEDFHKKLTEWTNAPSLAPTAWDGDSSWLGNILLHAGYKSFEIEEDGFPKHRGNITDIFGIEEKEQGADKYWYFDIQTDTAWVPLIKMWVYIVEKLYPQKIRIAYLATEEMNEFYMKYDPDNLFVPEKYCLWATITETQKLKKKYPAIAALASETNYHYLDSEKELSDYIIGMTGKILKDEKSLFEYINNELAADIEELSSDSYIQVYKIDTVPIIEGE